MGGYPWIQGLFLVTCLPFYCLLCQANLHRNFSTLAFLQASKARYSRAICLLVTCISKALVFRCRFLQLEEKENAGAKIPTRPADQPTKPLSNSTEEREKLPALATTWEAQCQKCLGASKAIAVLKASGCEDSITASS